MLPEQGRKLDEINNLQEQLTWLWLQYWKLYSNPSTWQFWFYTFLIVVPLVVLFFYIDRKRIFQICFYGYSVHLLMTYIDAYGVKNALWTYPYQAVPNPMGSMALDAAFVPAIHIMVYQWTLLRKKNYYLYAFGLSLFLAFLFKPALVAFELFQLSRGTQFYHLWFGYMTMALIAKWMTVLFQRLERSHPPDEGSVNIRTLNLRRFMSGRERSNT